MRKLKCPRCGGTTFNLSPDVPGVSICTCCRSKVAFSGIVGDWLVRNGGFWADFEPFCSEIDIQGVIPKDERE
jgi:hypothetical protein